LTTHQLLTPFLLALKNQKKKLAIVGGTQDDIEVFCRKLKQRYPSILIAASRSGYFNTATLDDELNEVIYSRPDVILVGMGGGNQENIMQRLRLLGFSGVTFSCGGFVSQVARGDNEDYYPKIINRLGLRFLYRMYREPHTIRRYLFLYPKNLITLIMYVFSGKVALRVDH
jgi:N-acetylglucosaminyldiphosphoundecaprenol N-acetyl-beta-D-mannosaminyltransferase